MFENKRQTLWISCFDGEKKSFCACERTRSMKPIDVVWSIPLISHLQPHFSSALHLKVGPLIHVPSNPEALLKFCITLLFMNSYLQRDEPCSRQAIAASCPSNWKKFRCLLEKKQSIFLIEGGSDIYCRSFSECNIRVSQLLPIIPCLLYYSADTLKLKERERERKVINSQQRSLQFKNNTGKELLLIKRINLPLFCQMTWIFIPLVIYELPCSSR